MRDAVYLNGVYERVLEEIVAVQAAVPDQILCLQPFAKFAISAMAKTFPTVEDPVRLFVSVTEDLAHVRYTGEIVGWEDKRQIDPVARSVYETLLANFQAGEALSWAKGINLLVVRRVMALQTPFPVEQLIVRSTMAPYKERKTSGHWAFVLPDAVGVPWPVRGPRVSQWGQVSTFDTMPPAAIR